MLKSPGLRLHLAGDGPGRSDFMRIGAHEHADVPFGPGEELPFEDGSADAIVLDALTDDMLPGARLQVLLECRRVLRPDGELHVTCAGAAGEVSPMDGRRCATDDVDDLAALIGLVAVDSRGNARRRDGAPDGAANERLFTKSDRTLRGDPLVSIAIPAYNARFFGACLESALAQTYDHLEIVVCDDSSGDEIAAMVASRAARRTVRYERNAARLRPRGNFVRCFERSRGEFVKLLCDDDVLEPRCVEKLLEAFRHAPDVTLATSQRTRIGAQGERLPALPATTAIVAQDTLIAGHTLANAMLMAGLNTIGEPSTALFRRRDFIDRGPDCFHFRGEAGHGVIDMVMWCVLLLRGNAVYRAEALSRFRSHPGQRQHDPARMQRNIDSIRSLQSAWLRLGLADLLPPDAILAKSFPPGAEDDWRVQPLLGFAARREPPSGMPRALRNAQG